MDKSPFVRKNLDTVANQLPYKFPPDTKRQKMVVLFRNNYAYFNTTRAAKSIEFISVLSIIKYGVII